MSSSIADVGETLIDLLRTELAALITQPAEIALLSLHMHTRRCALCAPGVC